MKSNLRKSKNPKVKLIFWLLRLLSLISIIFLTIICIYFSLLICVHIKKQLSRHHIFLYMTSNLEGYKTIPFMVGLNRGPLS
jgi:uncharacterized metal-binding protein